MGGAEKEPTKDQKNEKPALLRLYKAILELFGYESHKKNNLF